jgi:hypothetical protein
LIADIAIYPWSHYLERHAIDPAVHPELIRWRDMIGAREPMQNTTRLPARALQGSTIEMSMRAHLFSANLSAAATKWRVTHAPRNLP